MTTFTKRKKINFLWIVSGEALTFLLVVAASGFAHVTTRRPLPPFTANKGKLLQKLRDRKFQDLDGQLNSYQVAFEKDAFTEGNLAVAFEAFCSPDPALGPLLDEWVAKNPNSYPAHLEPAPSTW